MHRLRCIVGNFTLWIHYLQKYSSIHVYSNIIFLFNIILLVLKATGESEGVYWLFNHAVVTLLGRNYFLTSFHKTAVGKEARLKYHCIVLQCTILNVYVADILFNLFSLIAVRQGCANVFTATRADSNTSTYTCMLIQYFVAASIAS